MNTRKLLSLTLILILIISVTVVSAGLFYKPTPTPPTEPEWVKEIKKIEIDTHFKDNTKNISDFFKGFHKKNYPCGIFKKCPTPTPVPTPVPTTVPTPVPTPTIVPTVVPTPEPTPIPTKGDISVSGSSATPTILTSETLTIIANIRNTFNTIIDTKLEVQVFASEGQPIPFFQSKQLLIGTNGVETRIFEFSGLTEGTYQVRIRSPTLNGETSADNNAYNFYVKVLPKPTPTPTQPTPKPDIFDVSVTGKANIINTNNLEVLATVSHNSKDTIEGKVAVTVNGITQTKKIVMKHHDTLISDESSRFNFDVTNWKDGTTYPVTISFPIRNNEQNTINNVYTVDVAIPERPKTKVTDLDLSRMNTIYQNGRYPTQNGYFYIDYTITNKGDETTGLFTIETEGTVFYKDSVTLAKKETKSGRLLIRVSNLPYRQQVNGYTYLLKGKIIASGDTNTKNDVMYCYLGIKG
ncbi:MAG: hypothetical protein V1652_00165 [bacterium]